MKVEYTHRGILKRASIISMILLMLLATLPAQNNVVTGTSTVTIELSAGWNFEAMPESISASDLALKSGHITNIVRITSDGYYVSYVPSLRVTDFMCEPNGGIYIYSNADTNITFTISTIAGYISGDLFVSGNTILDKNLTVNGSMSVQGNFEINNLVVTDNLTISGNLTVHEDLAIGEDLSVNGNLTVGRNLTVGCLTVTYDITINGYLTVDRDVLVNGNITVMRDAIIYGNLTAGNFTVINLTISEDLTINGDLTVSGNATIGGDLFVTGNITGFVFTNTVNYIIFKDGANIVYAKNGDTGAIDFQSINASYVINSALAACPTGAGKVVLKAGVYDIDSTIKIPHGATLEGQGMGRSEGKISTELNWVGGASDVIIYNEAAVGHDSHRRGNGIYSLTVDGNDNSDAGIRVRYSMHHTIKDVTVKNAGGDGIVIEASYGQNIIDCDLTANDDNIYITNYSDKISTLIKIEGNEIGRATNYGIRAISGTRISLIKNWFENAIGDTGRHLYVNDLGAYTVQVRATDNTFGNFRDATHAIQIDGGRVYLNHNSIFAGGVNEIGIVMTDGYLQMEGNEVTPGTGAGRGVNITGCTYALIKGNSFLGASNSNYSIDVSGGSNILIDGNYFTGGGIYAHGWPGQLSIQNNMLNNIRTHYCIYTQANNYVIQNNNMRYCYKNGIYTDTAYGEITDNLFNDPGRLADNTYDAIYIDGGHNIVDYNHIFSNDANKPRYGIYVENENYVTVSNNYVQGTSTYDIYLTGGSYNRVVGNTVPDGKISVPPDSSYVVEDNVGFVTENTGTTSPGTSIVVTHGLDITPYRVIVTPLGNTSYYYVTNKGATDFTIISEASVAFEWYAVYDP